jgi:hypothetical protein
MGYRAGPAGFERDPAAELPVRCGRGLIEDGEMKKFFCQESESNVFKLTLLLALAGFAVMVVIAAMSSTMY